MIVLVLVIVMCMAMVVVLVDYCSGSLRNMMKRPHGGGLNYWMHRAGNFVDVAAVVILNRSPARWEQHQRAANTLL
jgi:hypothetical protein